MAVNSFFISIMFSASLVFVALWAALYLFLKYKRTYWKKRGIPFVSGHWFFGTAKDTLLMRHSPGDMLCTIYNQASENDDVIGFYIFHRPFLMLRNPELIKRVLIKDFQIFSNRYFTAKTRYDNIGSSSLFAVKNSQWRYLRTNITPIFTSGKLKKLFPLMIESSEWTQEYLEKMFSDGTKTKSIPMKGVIGKYATNIMSTVSFGIHMNAFDESYTQFATITYKLGRRTFYGGLQMFFMFFFPSIAWYFGRNIFGSFTDYYSKIFWDSLKSREVSKAKGGDLLDRLMDLKNKKAEHENIDVGEDTLLGQPAIFFIGGRGTVIAAICFALSELAKNPDIQRRTRDEILEKVQTHGMTYEAVQEMKYLNQVISEALRLCPIVPLLNRVASQDYKVPESDLVIEKGTAIYVSLHGLHRDARYFPDPLRFDPDRFSDENKKNILPYTYMPFGEGPRICIGVRLGLLQCAIGIITILKDYEISVDPGNECIMDPRHVFLQPQDNFILNLTKLSSI